MNCIALEGTSFNAWAASLCPCEGLGLSGCLVAGRAGGVSGCLVAGRAGGVSGCLALCRAEVVRVDLE